METVLTFKVYNSDLEGKNVWNNDSIKYIIVLSTSHILSTILIFKATTLHLKSSQLNYIQQDKNYCQPL